MFAHSRISVDLESLRKKEGLLIFNASGAKNSPTIEVISLEIGLKSISTIIVARVEKDINRGGSRIFRRGGGCTTKEWRN